ncbi:VOC family protein [Nocardia sp. Root136]|uniref:VOC family protein n=1 Tax=Nocardia sp. Root136 TaxID=1736458 RepID=UPI000AC6122A
MWVGWHATRHRRPGRTSNSSPRTRPAPENPVVSVKVDDVEAALAAAQQRGYEIVYPLTTEPWGITRFFVRAPDGNVFNIAQHRD